MTYFLVADKIYETPVSKTHNILKPYWKYHNRGLLKDWKMYSRLTTHTSKTHSFFEPLEIWVTDYYRRQRVKDIIFFINKHYIDISSLEIGKFLFIATCLNFTLYVDSVFLLDTHRTWFCYIFYTIINIYLWIRCFFSPSSFFLIKDKICFFYKKLESIFFSLCFDSEIDGKNYIFNLYS